MHSKVISVLAAQLGVVCIVSAQPYAYVSNISGNNLSVVNTANLSVVASIPVPVGPTGMAVAPDGSKLYVASQSAGTVSVIDTSNNSVVGSIQVGGTPTRLAVSPNGAQLYVASQGTNQVSIIDTGSKAVVGVVAAGYKPTAVVFSPDGARAFVSNAFSGDVYVIDTASKSVSGKFAAASGPSDVAVSRDGRFVYVANQYSGSVTVHDASSGNLVASVGGLAFPNAIGVTPNGQRLYVTNGNSGAVSVIDTGGNSLIATIPVGPLPTSVAISADGGRAYITNENGFSLSVIDTGSNSVATTVSRVGVYPVAVVIAQQSQANPVPPPVPSCTYSVTPGNVSFGSAGGNGTLNVSVSNGCSWSASSNANWISISSGANGNGSGTIAFAVTPNAALGGRSGNITVGGQSFTISQSGLTCAYILSSGGASLNAGGGSGSVTVTAPSGCTWNASSDSSWLVLNASGGNGTSVISFQASANSGTGARTANLNIAGQGFSVTQAGAAFSAIRVNCGGPAVVDPSGNVWSADDQGNRAMTSAPIAGTNFPALYQKESWSSGTLQYQYAVPNGSFTVKLHFSEFYLTQPGARRFDIVINGTTVFPAFDVLAHTGPNTAHVQTFGVTVSNGQVTVQLVPVGGSSPKLAGLEIY